MAHRHARRSHKFGSVGSRRRSSRKASRSPLRNPWAEKKVFATFSGKDQQGRAVKWTVGKAPGHHNAALKGWDDVRKKFARGPGRKYAAPHGKYQPRHLSMSRRANIPQMSDKEPGRADKPRRLRGAPESSVRASEASIRAAAKPASRRSKPASRRRKPAAAAATRGGKRGAKRATRRNGRYARAMRRAASRMGRAASRIGRSAARRGRNLMGRFTSSRRRPAKRKSKSRRTRRNGYVDMIMPYAAVGVGLVSASYIASKAVDYLSTPDASGKSMIPDSLKEYAPAILTAGAAAAVWFVAKKYGGAKAQPFLKPLMYGGAAATIVQLGLNVRFKGSNGIEQSLMQMILPKTTRVSAPSSAPAIPAASTGDYGVFGYTSVDGMGDYGVFGLGSPLAVEGVIDVPGGGLAVQGLGATTLSDSVLGTPTRNALPAPNPFAAGLRDGNRGTLNEPHAAEVADSGSLSGNIFN